ncbi:uncharacterized protein LOC112552932 [Pogonomyrmex barbatus]|uniref:Uncharacterized protein LOC112552932 n=1 Tax=Pogonomyrmex barbatus TaxID=144034 RepID=A0A8N1SAQ2_9HYME|nr:uncharacterized protein LOC112552932 [Pogonomyrmex barbatus]
MCGCACMCAHGAQRRQVNAARSSHTDSRAATENRVPGGPSTDSPPDENGRSPVLTRGRSRSRLMPGLHAPKTAGVKCPIFTAHFMHSKYSPIFGRGKKERRKTHEILHLAPLFARRCCPSPQAREDTDQTPTCEVYRVL